MPLQNGKIYSNFENSKDTAKMTKPTPKIPQEEIAAQLAYCGQIAAMARLGAAYVDTYGCQQNEADSEKLRGYLEKMGCRITRDENKADIVVVNTCAIREHAEMRALGNVGALTHTKRHNKNQIVVICGCMVQQEHMAEKIKNSYRHVDLVFGPQALWRFPELLHRTLTGNMRVFDRDETEGAIAEGIPVLRDNGVKAWLPVMYGCNNFCSYCVVPFVRGRERSREPSDVLENAKKLVAEGARDITLLGQNVNSYSGGGTSFPELIRKINDIPGDFRLRFMTSHPKDAGEELFRAMAESEKCARHLHLPVQSGSDSVLREMNRGYTCAHYMKLALQAREFMPDLVLTSDIIVGFPGESEQDFENTINLIETVRFDALFTFIYSRREGTRAALIPDDTPREEISRRFDRLLAVQNSISAEKHAAYVGKTMRVLVDSAGSGASHNLSARTDGGRLVHLSGSEALVGSYAYAKITGASTWALFGEISE